MDSGDLCLCLHSREEHFGCECSRVNCRCSKFAIIDSGPVLLRVMRQIFEVAKGSPVQTEAIHQIRIWSEKALRIAEEQ